MRIVVVGGGPGGLYAAALLKKAAPKREVVVYERNRPDDTFGFGVVFSDATLGNIEAADPEVYGAIASNMARWDDIDVYFRGGCLRSTGHGFAGLSRQRLLTLLQARCSELGVEMHFEHPVDDVEALDADVVIAADGLNSGVRTRFADAFEPLIETGRNRFTWLGTRQRFPAFTFDFVANEHGLWRLHAYNFEDGLSTFIVETTDAAWRAAELDASTEAETAAFCEKLFAARLDGHPLLTNHSIWRQFPTVSNRRWHHGRYVLLGDAAHTAHFSVGSGTKLAMEDGIALAAALNEGHSTLGAALAAYESERRPVVESTQRAAAVSLRWFEETERYVDRLDPRQFTFSLLTRSLRITHSNLAVRDPAFVDATDRWFAAGAGVEVAPDSKPPPPVFTPFSMRGLTLHNRVVVSPMCQYCATDGVVDDWHLVHLGSRAVGGAALTITEMTDVSPEGRITPGCAGLWNDTQGAAWKRIVDFVHAQGGAIGIQLAHAGRKGSTSRPWEGDAPLSGDEAWPTIAASAVPFGPGWPTPRAMDEAELVRVREAFVAATKRAEVAGFDLVELHAAHGYLLHGFLSPIANRRTDRYGGDLEGRMRYPLEVFEAMRAVWPAHKPMAVRISASDWSDEGFTPDEAVVFCAALRDLGCDLVDVSSGGISPDLRPVYGRLYQTPFAERVRLEADIATVTVGNISSYADVNSVLAAGRADLCAIARGHLVDPYWTLHAAYEQFYRGDAARWPVQYGWATERYTPRFEWSPRGTGS